MSPVWRLGRGVHREDAAIEETRDATAVAVASVDQVVNVPLREPGEDSISFQRSAEAGSLGAQFIESRAKGAFGFRQVVVENSSVERRDGNFARARDKPGPRVILGREAHATGLRLDRAIKAAIDASTVAGGAGAATSPAFDSHTRVEE